MTNEFCPACKHWTLKILTWGGAVIFVVCLNCFAHFPREIKK